MPPTLVGAVAVLSHNRRRHLLLALESLEKQDILAATREIIVVLNACTDGSREAIAERFAALPGLVVVDEPALGLCYAAEPGPGSGTLADHRVSR